MPDRDITTATDLATGAQPLVRSTTYGEQSIWRPTEPTFTTFMSFAVNCPACRMAREAAGLRPVGFLHVCQFGPTLVITEADDVHHPGRSIAATLIWDMPAKCLFRLLGEAPPGLQLPCFVPAAGMVELSRSSGRRRMRAYGSVAGFATHAQDLFDAIEACN